jgi:hypothetical protein
MIDIDKTADILARHTRWDCDRIINYPIKVSLALQFSIKLAAIKVSCKQMDDGYSYRSRESIYIGRLVEVYPKH